MEERHGPQTTTRLRGKDGRLRQKYRHALRIYYLILIAFLRAVTRTRLTDTLYVYCLVILQWPDYEVYDRVTGDLG